MMFQSPQECNADSYEYVMVATNCLIVTAMNS